MACIYRLRQSCCSVRWAVLLTMTFTQTISLHKRFQKSQCPVGRQAGSNLATSASPSSARNRQAPNRASHKRIPSLPTSG